MMLKAACNELGALTFAPPPVLLLSLEQNSQEPKFCFSFQVILLYSILGCPDYLCTQGTKYVKL
jgi:hypothetical protein